MCLAAYPPKFKVGDRVRIKPNAKTIRPQSDNPTWVESMDNHQGEVFVISKLSTRAPWIFGPGNWRYHPDWIEPAYPDTPAGRKQEQLDIIAEKEVVLAETQKVIDEARAKITEIDNRPPTPGDVYKSAHSGVEYSFTIVNVFTFEDVEYCNYRMKGGTVACTPIKTWSNGAYTRVS